MYKECSIQSAHGGFGMYESKEYGSDGFSSLQEMLGVASENVGEIFELGVDELPDGVENILGRIYNQPDRVFYVSVEHIENGYYYGVSDFSEK